MLRVTVRPYRRSNTFRFGHPPGHQGGLPPLRKRKYRRRAQRGQANQERWRYAG